MDDLPAHLPRQSRHGLLTAWLYFLAMLGEFRRSLIMMALVIVLGGLLYHITPQSQLENKTPSAGEALYAAWMALLNQPLYYPPRSWYLMLVTAIYPIVGLVLIGEGVIRFALLMFSRRHGEKEWMKVMASTYRNHIVICGLGHLGTRVVQQLVAAKVEVVAIEKDEKGRFLPQVREMGVPILLRDMKEDQSLLDAGIRSARAVVIATNDDMANLEVALDARRLHPGIRVVMRLFDQQIASKIADAFHIDAAFSASALSAPIVAAMSLDTKVLASMVIAGVPHVTVELEVHVGGALSDQSVEELESQRPLRVLALSRDGRTIQSPQRTERIRSGDRLVIHAAATDLASFAEAKMASEMA